ncbi:unnamed protein product [Paramecium sonneborni]|uniref:Uncharacterized protein n=1 Tax=Paramecium sonneborni TaxID=65129 RepID=A0A8S1P037_9CILI|nr:unnamed protein product [Paramecium sonneborni]
MNLEFKQQCSIHQKEILLFNLKETIPSQRKLCLKCLTEQNPELVSISDFNSQVMSIHDQMIKLQSNSQGIFSNATTDDDYQWLRQVSQKISNITCNKHGQDSIIINKRCQANNKFCLQCIAEIQSGYILIDELITILLKIKKNILEEANEIKEFKIYIFKKQKELLINYKNQIEQKINKFLQRIDQLIELVAKSYCNQKDFIEKISIDDIDLMIDQLCQTQVNQTNFEEIKKILIENIENLQLQEEIQHLKLWTDKLLLENSNQTFDFISQFRQTGKIELQLPKFKFKKISSQVQIGWCDTIEINKESTLILLGCQTDIKACQFKNGQIKQICKFHGHEWIVTCLKFMSQSNYFISAGRDKKIKIWLNVGMAQQKEIAVLVGHKNLITCVISNLDESLIISSSEDWTIKFWAKFNKWKCIQTITNHTDSVFSLCLSNSGQKVISCGKDGQILVLQQISQGIQQTWNVVQTITEQWGRRLCFIGENRFTFQPYCKEIMCIFDFNKTNGEFIKIKEVKVAGGKICSQFFHQQYSNKKSILVSKNCRSINIMEIQEIGDCHQVQTLDFDTQFIYGAINNDGEYLIVWDQNKKTIDTLKYTQLS